MLNLIRAATATPKLKIANTDYNITEVIKLTKEAHVQNVHVLTFTELSITGYNCEDLFFQSTLIKGAEDALVQFLDTTKEVDMIVVIGLPIAAHNQLFNCAAVCHMGKIMGLVPKMYMPNSGEYGERRWFSPAFDLTWDEIELCGQLVPMGNDILFKCMGTDALIGVEICQDIWETIPPSSYQALAGANVILNLTAATETAMKHNIRRSVVQNQSLKTISAYVFAASGVWESSCGGVFSGHSMICENGAVLIEGKRFSLESELLIGDIDIELIMNKRRRENGYMACHDNGGQRGYSIIEIPIKVCEPKKIIRHISANPYLPKDKSAQESACEDIFNIQSIGLMRRLAHVGAMKCVLGVSGGLDSTLALLVSVKAMELLGVGRENIIGLVMPGFGTTNRSLENAYALMKNLGITTREIDIKPACLQHFKDIGHDPNVYDIVFENTQARERTQIAMDIANKESAIMVGTANMSEIALGFSTFGGDHMSMYNVNCGVPKTIVRTMAQWLADTDMFGADVPKTLKSILEAPISPELLPPDESGNTEQKTEEIVGPYEVIDFFMYHMISSGFRPSKIIELALHAFGGEYSRKLLKIMLGNFYRRFFVNAYKRNCAPDGPKVMSIGLLSKGDLKMPSDVSYNLWLRELEEYE